MRQLIDWKKKSTSAVKLHIHQATDQARMKKKQELKKHTKAREEKLSTDIRKLTIVNNQEEIRNFSVILLDPITPDNVSDFSENYSKDFNNKASNLETRISQTFAIS